MIIIWKGIRNIENIDQNIVFWPDMGCFRPICGLCRGTYPVSRPKSAQSWILKCLQDCLDKSY